MVTSVTGPRRVCQGSRSAHFISKHFSFSSVDSSSPFPYFLFYSFFSSSQLPSSTCFRLFHGDSSSIPIFASISNAPWSSPACWKGYSTFEYTAAFVFETQLKHPVKQLSFLVCVRFRVKFFCFFVSVFSQCPR